MLIDETCSCDYETDQDECICFGRVTPPKVCCRACTGGKHQLEAKRPLAGIVRGAEATF